MPNNNGFIMANNGYILANNGYIMATSWQIMVIWWVIKVEPIWLMIWLVLSNPGSSIEMMKFPNEWTNKNNPNHQAASELWDLFPYILISREREIVRRCIYLRCDYVYMCLYVHIWICDDEMYCARYYGVIFYQWTRYGTIIQVLHGFHLAIHSENPR